MHQTIAVQQRGPWSSNPTKGLSTLNSMAFGLAVYASQGRLPDTTQDSLPVAGQALLDGVLTRKVPMKGFKVEFYIFLSPFPKLAWRKRRNRRAIAGQMLSHLRSRFTPLGLSRIHADRTLDGLVASPWERSL